MGNLESLILYWLYSEIKINAYFKHSFYTFFYIVLRFNEINNLIHSLDEKILDILCSSFNLKLISLGRRLSTILELLFCLFILFLHRYIYISRQDNYIKVVKYSTNDTKRLCWSRLFCIDTLEHFPRKRYPSDVKTTVWWITAKEQLACH